MKLRPFALLEGAVCSIAAAGFVAAVSFASAQEGANIWQGAYTAEQAASGKALYDAQCAVCHGATLAGADAAPPLAGPAFLSNWNGLSAKDLFDRVRDTMPADKPGSLSAPHTAEIVAYMFQASGFPAAAKPLPDTAPALASVKIVATKP